jgi:hypothetical protein
VQVLAVAAAVVAVGPRDVGVPMDLGVPTVQLVESAAAPEAAGWISVAAACVEVHPRQFLAAAAAARTFAAVA